MGSHQKQRTRGRARKWPHWLIRACGIDMLLTGALLTAAAVVGHHPRLAGVAVLHLAVGLLLIVPGWTDPTAGPTGRRDQLEEGTTDG